MKLSRIVFMPVVAAAALMVQCPEAGAWGREGHETIAKLAELNLNKSTKKKVEKYLGGHSIVYVAKWMDEVRKTPEYRYTDKWHTSNVDENLEYAPRENGDAVYGIETALKTLENYKNLPDSVVALNIRILTHLIGDMHCPSHVNYVDKKLNYDVQIEDPNHFYVKYSGHAMWDMGFIRSFRFMCASEWAAELNKVLSKEDKKAMAAGTPREWLHDNAVRCLAQFDIAHPDEKLSAAVSPIAMPLIEAEISYAGIRLAGVLNTIFK